MLMVHPDLDKHLDFLEDKSGGSYFVPRCDIHKKGCATFFKVVTDDIMSSPYMHTGIFVEEPSKREKKLIVSTLKKIGAKVEAEEQLHYIHGFFLPRELFEIMDRENKAHLN